MRGLDGQRHRRRRRPSSTSPSAARCSRPSATPALRADFLARAGAILDASLDYEETLSNVAEIAVPEIADWCAVSILDDDGVLREVATANVDPAKRAARRASSAAASRPTRHAARRHAAGSRARARRRSSARSPTRCSSPASRTPSSSTLVRAARPALGRSSRRCTARGADVRDAHARQRRVAAGCSTTPTSSSPRSSRAAPAMAIENARLYTERTRIAHTLQVQPAARAPAGDPGRACSPPATAPRASSTRSAATSTTSSRARRAEWALVVGDVSGKGAEAAAITALARYTLRAAALEDGAPSGALRRLNRRCSARRHVAVRHRRARLPLGRRRRRASTSALALGGHPPPLVAARATGASRRRAATATCSGSLEDPALHDVDLTLAPGDVLLLYTDGVTEAGPARPAARRARPARPARRLRGRDAARQSSTPSSRPSSTRSRASRATTSRCSR